ncbi:DNA mismatch repair endonuclease MutL [bacterium]|nr:DNA mismatch repair endonuclease MutL [bacterium]MBP9811116.1 DNA mismatch repair endonuclease MutL [bacterium]
MPKVLVLPDHIASQIAAGEVVERPASVVKELVENSLDAGASEIEISVSQDCRDIRIADNGSGMDPDDAVLAFQRHATSKLRSADDLWTLNTLGFRGEAIPSIASISKFTCYTRTQQAEVGTRVETADGQLKAVEVGCAPGTVMEIQELFYNTPARLKFMKKAATEFGNIEEIVQSLAISYPDVAFILLNNGNTALRTSGSGDLARTIVEAGFFTGKERLVEVSHGYEIDEITVGSKAVRIKGYLAKPTHFRGDRKGILTIVNGRAVRCPLTYKALDYAFSDLIPRGRYPLAVVQLEIDPGQVDVNIHPTKKELNYTHGNDIYLTIQRALGRALREESIARAEQARAEHDKLVAEEQNSAGSYDAQPHSAQHIGQEFAQQRSHEAARISQPATKVEQINFRDNLSYQASADYAVPPSYSAGNTSHESQDSYVDHTPSYAPVYAPTTTAQRQQELDREIERELFDYTPASKPEAGEIFLSDSVHESSADSSFHSGSELFELPSDWRIIGYLRNTYIMVETSNGLEIIEQHIAHERTLYERLLASQTTAGRISENSQKLIVSAPLALSPEQLETLRLSQSALEKLGFAFVFEEDNASVSELPLELARVNYVPVIQKLIDDLATVDATNMELEATKSIACQSAIKNGMALSHRDILKLLSDWLKTERNDTCPHGRPVRLKFSMDELFQMFHPA